VISALRASRARLVVDARGSVERLAAAWGAAAPGTAFVVLLLPPHGLEAHRLLGFCRAARVETTAKSIFCIAVAQPEGGGAPAAAALPALGALCLRAAGGREAELLAASDGRGCWAPRLRPLRLPPPATPAPALAPAPTRPAAAVGTPRPELLRAPGAPRWALAAAAPGQLTSLALHRLELPALREGEVRLQVEAVSLHFRWASAGSDSRTTVMVYGLYGLFGPRS
jgi:hypothetical protein